jgi:hypothetical protein
VPLKGALPPPGTVFGQGYLASVGLALIVDDD